MALITAPAKEKGQAFLKRETKMWSWMPGISLIIKLSPAMMTDSGYTNDGILKEFSLVVNFTPKIIGSENINEWKCWKIEFLPKEFAAVVLEKSLAE